MNNKQRMELLDICLQALPDAAVCNLMEHAANETPVILGKRNGDVRFDYFKNGAG